MHPLTILTGLLALATSTTAGTIWLHDNLGSCIFEVNDVCGCTNAMFASTNFNCKDMPDINHGTPLNGCWGSWGAERRADDQWEVAWDEHNGCKTKCTLKTGKSCEAVPYN
ncbi:MAG: hypothetical protein Q9223_007682 [Gallowayella weberi]